MRAQRRSLAAGKSPANKSAKPTKAVQNGRVGRPKSSGPKPKATSTKQTKTSKKSPGKKTMKKTLVKAVANGLTKSPTKGSKPGHADPKKPPKFSYVVDGLLAGMGRPTQHGHMQYLCDNGFKYLVTLTLNKPRAILEYPGEGLEWVHIPIQDETPPSVEQITQFVSLVDKAKTEKTSVAVHCAWGRGRTGTMLACYLAKAGRLSVDAAVEEIRRLRPGSIDTEKQMDSLRKYVASIKS